MKTPIFFSSGYPILFLNFLAMIKKITVIFLILTNLSSLSQSGFSDKISIEYRGNESDKPIYPIQITCSDSSYYLKLRDTGDFFYYDSSVFNRLRNFIEEPNKRQEINKDQWGENRYSFIIIINNESKTIMYFFDNKNSSINFFWNVALFVNEMQWSKQNSYLIYCLQNRIVRLIGLDEYRRKYNRFYNTITCY